MSVQIIRKNPGWLDQLLGRYRQQAELAVGYPLGTSGTSTRYPDGTSVLMVAAVNNFGSPSRGIPARPFMHEGGPEAVKATEPVAAVMVPLVNAGKATIEDALREMGPYAQGAMQDKITSGPWEPNAPRTVAEKGSAQPLIDTGLLRSTLTWAVRKPRA